MSALAVKRLTAPGFYSVGGVAGLALQVRHEDARSWILRTVVGGRRRDFGLGPYPEIGLAAARDRARACKEQVAQGLDPAALRAEHKAQLTAAEAMRLTFRQAAERCLRVKTQQFKNAKHAKQWAATLKTYAYPIIGHVPVADVELHHVLSVLEPIWTSKTETASRLRQRIENVLAWATVNEYRKGDNPARWRGHLQHALPAPASIKKVKHHTALPHAEVPEFMQELRKRDGMAARALEFAVLTAARSGEVRGMRWDEVDLTAKLWTISAQRMKAKRAHVVPLSPAAVKLLRSLPRMQGSALVFPAARGGQLSDMSLSAVCRRMEVDCVPHGFRSSFKDWARTSTNYPDEVSELALAHVSSDQTRAAYARDGLLEQRRKLLGDWARFIR